MSYKDLENRLKEAIELRDRAEHRAKAAEAELKTTEEVYRMALEDALDTTGVSTVLARRLGAA